jgi:hypothetical protein
MLRHHIYREFIKATDRYGPEVARPPAAPEGGPAKATG